MKRILPIAWVLFLFAGCAPIPDAIDQSSSIFLAVHSKKAFGNNNIYRVDGRPAFLSGEEIAIDYNESLSWYVNRTIFDKIEVGKCYKIVGCDQGTVSADLVVGKLVPMKINAEAQ